MFNFDAELFSTSDFDQQTRLLTVDQLVMFPRVLAACNIRKRAQVELIEAAMQTNHLIAVGVAAVPVEVACLCRIMAMRHDDAGGMQLILMGLHRVRVGVPVAVSAQREMRQAELCDDNNHVSDPNEGGFLLKSLREVMQGLFVAGGAPVEAFSQFDIIFSGKIPLGGVCDILASMVEIDVAEKGVILAEIEVARRAKLLLTALTKLAIQNQLKLLAESPSFPAAFSVN